MALFLLPVCCLPGCPPPTPPHHALHYLIPHPQVFSLAYGSVHEEVNSLKRGAGRSRHKGEHNLVARVSEEGVTFRSYRCQGGWRGGGI